MIYVIGSGPAGVSVAKALLDKKLHVTMIDAGLNITHTSKDKNSLNANKFHPKLVMGSDFPYRNVNKFLTIRAKKFFISYAQGGLSNVWGAAMLPFREKDIKNWPKKTLKIFKYYKKILEFVPYSGAIDSINDLFNFFPIKNNHCVTNSDSIKEIFEHLNLNHKELKNRGIVFGHSKLAVSFNEPLNKCDYCGKCMESCPKNLIFNSFNVIKELEKNTNFHYKSGYIVNKVKEGSDGTVSITVRKEGKIELIKGERVYIAAGALGTARILCSSNYLYNQPLTIKDSQYFVIPFIKLKKISEPNETQDYSLAKIFIEINTNGVDGYKTSHIQLYNLNESILKVIKKRLSIFGFMLTPFMKLLSGRLFIMQGYLHSDDSSAINFVLKKNGEQELLDLTFSKSKKTKHVVKKIVQKINSNKKNFGGYAVSFLTKIGYPGEGNHFGGMFPMSDKPTALETDIYGRFSTSKKIHLVDSSVLPSIPSSTITFSVMANAYRIGNEYEKYK